MSLKISQHPFASLFLLLQFNLPDRSGNEYSTQWELDSRVLKEVFTSKFSLPFLRGTGFLKSLNLRILLSVFVKIFLMFLLTPCLPSIFGIPLERHCQPGLRREILFLCVIYVFSL